MATFPPPTDFWPDDSPSVLPPRGISEEDFERWAFEQELVRAEWVDGEVVIMSPVNREHNDLFHWIARLLGNYVEDRDLGEVMGPEFFVRFGKQRRRRLPDVLFVSSNRRSLLKRTYLDGPPDAIFEIVSDDSVVRDWQEKYAEYEQAGVREYWIVDPLSQRLEAFHLGDDGRYVPIADADGKLSSQVVSGWYLRKEWLWGEDRPKVSAALREMQD